MIGGKIQVGSLHRPVTHQHDRSTRILASQRQPYLLTAQKRRQRIGLPVFLQSFAGGLFERFGLPNRRGVGRTHQVARRQ